MAEDEAGREDRFAGIVMYRSLSEVVVSTGHSKVEEFMPTNAFYSGHPSLYDRKMVTCVKSLRAKGTNGCS